MRHFLSHRPQHDNAHQYDPLLLSVCISLLMIGYIMMFSSSLHLKTSIGGQILHFPLRQLLFISLGLGMAWTVTLIPMRFWEKAGPWLFILGLVLLLLVLHPKLGVEVNGSRRWLLIAGIRIQVSEAMKFATVIYMAGYVVRHQQELQMSPLSMLRPLFLMGLACGLLLKEPDYGSTVVIVTIAMGIMFLSGAKIKQFFILLLILMVVGAFLVMAEDYRVRRITAYLNPWDDVRDSGYQLVQALVSFGRGEVFGVGVGNGIQKLFYLPEGHTDFLFSVLGEELGLIGVLTVIALYSVLIWKGFNIAAQAEQAGQTYSAYAAYGMSIWIGFQSFVNMGVNMGVLPTKGITLPLMSYGGGSMIIMCSAIAVLFRVQMEARQLLQKQQEQVVTWINAS